MDETVDVVDEHNNLTGKVCLKSHAHKTGIWHRNAHIWIYTSDGKILLQLRSKEKPFFPDVWDISVAGHIATKEEPEECAIREIAEEIGLHVDKSRLKFVKIKKCGIKFKDIINNEFYYIYTLLLKEDIKNLQVQAEEVQKIELFSLQELNELLKNKPDQFFKHELYWKEMIEHISKLVS